MDVFVRRRSLVLIVIAACAPKPGAPVGVSENRPTAHASSIAPKPDVPSPIPADFRSKYAKVTARFSSAGHFVGRYDAVIWASEDAADGFKKQTSFPDGSRLVMEHLQRGSDQVGPLLMMERRTNAWRWTMVASDGRVIVDGDANACAQCHAEAPRDSVFFVQ